MKPEKTHWYECKLWKKFKQCGASRNDPWGLQHIMNYKKQKDGHYCAMNDREHEVIRKFKEGKNKITNLLDLKVESK